MKNLVKRIILKIYSLVKRIKNLIRPLFYWYIPNIIPIINDQIQITGSRVPKCAQLTKVTGVGRIVIGEDCKFGFKLGEVMTLDVLNSSQDIKSHS